MKPEEIAEKLKTNGWREENISELAPNNLNKGVHTYFTYKDKLSFRYHPAEKFIRLMVYGKTSQENFKVDYIHKIDKSLDNIGHNDVRGFQVDCKNDPGEALDCIISMQGDITLDSYFNFYMQIQSTAGVSILTVEQFI